MNWIIKTIEKGCFLTAIIGGSTTLTILIIVIGIFKECFGTKPDPMDNTYMVKREMYSRNHVVDSTGVGFDLVWYTTEAVSRERAEEIRSREHIRKTHKRLLSTAADHFKHDFFNTDIYDMAEYARKFDIDKDIRLVNIFVHGLRLKEQYWQPNPNLPGGGCTKPDHGTDQGILYINENDINFYFEKNTRRYRYWKCHATSLTDERYTHFTESERIQE